METYQEAKIRFTANTPIRSGNFVDYFNPKDANHVNLVNALRAKLRAENKLVEYKKAPYGNSMVKIVKRVITEYRLPKGANSKTAKGYQGNSMPHYHADEAVIGLLYVREVYVY